MAYRLAIRRLDGSYHIDQKIYESEAPQFGSMIEIEFGAERIKVQITGMRTVPGHGVGARASDRVDAFEVA